MNSAIVNGLSSSLHGGSLLFTISTAFFSFIARSSRLRNIEKKMSSVTFKSQEEIRDYWTKFDGEHLYLEEVLGPDALKWVNEQNLKVIGKGNPMSSPLYDRVLKILDSKDKIPHLTKIGDFYYNFWQDGNNPRGVLRRTTLESYNSDTVQWETVIDFDKLGKVENVSWVYNGHDAYFPDDGSQPRRTLIKLSVGGADAVEIREFDLQSLSFIPADEGGFYIPEAKNRVNWYSANELLIGTDIFRDGVTLTDSGYPKESRLWTRCTPITNAILGFDGEKYDISVSDYTVTHRGYKFEWRDRSLTFYTSKYFVRPLPLALSSSFWSSQQKSFSSSDYHQASLWYELGDIPIDASLSQFGDQMIISLRSDWIVDISGITTTFPSGALLIVGIMEFIQKGPSRASITTLFTPLPRVSMSSYTSTLNYIIIEILENVESKLLFWKYLEEPGSSTITSTLKDPSKGVWILEKTEETAHIRGTSIRAVDSDKSDLFWFTISSFLQPSSLYLLDANIVSTCLITSEMKPIKSLPKQFNTTNLIELQFETISLDGTKIPYFILMRNDLILNKKNPTLLYGYGGFEISLLPSYAAVTGVSWLEKGGVYVSANIRGGGEFGPNWHQAALKANRYKAYDDFIAVAEDLIQRGITSPKHLGIRGGSNGGLLMGNMLIRRPDLFGAIVCAVPLLDMKRYHKLLAGASWTAEYGNPDIPEDWAYLQKYSAYHNINPNQDTLDTANPVEKWRQKYPPFLMTTSTRDDRVHPYHARAFVKRLLDVGVSNTLYYENIEGGHGGAADNKQQAFMTVLYINFLLQTIGMDTPLYVTDIE